MAKQDKDKLKDWFRTGKFPTQEQFWDWMDSYIHRDDQLRISANFPELDGVLQQKVDKEAFKYYSESQDNPHRVTKQQVGLGLADNTADVDKPVSIATQSALDLKADQTVVSLHVNDSANPHQVTKEQIGLGQADNTADVDKPISNNTQIALNLKADVKTVSKHVQDYENPHRVSKQQIGLGHVDDTADVDKPISKATQDALDLKADKAHIHAANTLTGFDTDATLATNSDEKVASQKAVKAYVDTIHTTLQGRISKLENQLIPGMIMAWKGSIGTIPAGWKLCEELKDKFVLGAGADFAVGATGGARTHQLKVSEMPAHTHQVGKVLAPDESKSSGVFHSSDKGKSEFIPLNSEQIGGNQAHENMPPYYALAYIEYVGFEDTAA